MANETDVSCSFMVFGPMINSSFNPSTTKTCVCSCSSAIVNIYFRLFKPKTCIVEPVAPCNSLMPSVECGVSEDEHTTDSYTSRRITVKTAPVSIRADVWKYSPSVVISTGT